MQNATSTEKQESMEVAESARETEWQHPSFVGEIFMGYFHQNQVFPYPLQPEEDRLLGDKYLQKIESFLKANVDPEQIDQSGEMPASVIHGLANLGAFGMKIPKEYGGLGLSNTNYNRVIELVASHCGSTAVWLSAHQSIGVPQPLKLFGTPEQKQKYLPRFAKGAISAFALTEPAVGSDPARMSTTATPTEDGRFFILNGEKLWCTNGPVAEVIVVMARTPDKIKDGKSKKQITAFIVETNSPGFEVVRRCQFMGLKAIQNGLLRFHDVKVPRENILWGEGLGLKLALITLNTGRLTLPAASVGTAKACLNITRRWANERVQWGLPIGKHDAVAQKIASMTATTFAMEAMTWFTSALADRGGSDIRLEAAIAKLFCSEAGWKIVDDTLQIRGGRGYETAKSLQARGETPFPVERMMRDFRINLIIEGSSEIQRLFIAREALDPHMRVAGALLNPKTSGLEKIKTIGKMLKFYSAWYPARWLNFPSWHSHKELGELAFCFRYVEKQSNHLGRAIFHAMTHYQGKLEHRQELLARLVNIGMELFAIATTCARAQALLELNPSDRSPIVLARLFFEQAQLRIAQSFYALRHNNDVFNYKVAQAVLGGKFSWLETGIITTEDNLSDSRAQNQNRPSPARRQVSAR